MIKMTFCLHIIEFSRKTLHGRYSGKVNIYVCFDIRPTKSSLNEIMVIISNVRPEPFGVRPPSAM
jgi:hypothetical protein